MLNVGFVKWFDPNRGYGFITHGNFGQDVFVHFSNIQTGRLGYRSLKDGQRVSYYLVYGKCGPTAINVRPL